MADITDLAQQVAFLQAGGQAPGTTSMDQFNQGSDIVGKVISNVLAIKKAKYDNAKTQQETNKLKIGNTPVVEAYGTPIIKNQIAAAEAAPIPAEDLASGILNSRQKSLDDIAQNSRNMTAKYGNMTTDQYKDMGAAYHDFNPTTTTPEDMQPLYKIMNFNQAKKVVPTLTQEEFSTMTYGGLKQYVARNNHTDLNKSRDFNQELRLDNALMQAGDNLNMMLKPIREQKMALAGSSELIDMIRGGNTNAAAALGLRQAKSLGEAGAMSEKDVTRYVQSGLISQRAGDILGKWLTGTPTGATMNEIAEVNQAMIKVLDARENDMVNEMAGRISNNYGLTPEEAVMRLGKHVKQPGGGGTTVHDKALEWARANPNDPRAAAIIQKANQAKGQQ